MCLAILFYLTIALSSEYLLIIILGIHLCAYSIGKYFTLNETFAFIRRVYHIWINTYSKTPLYVLIECGFAFTLVQ